MLDSTTIEYAKLCWKNLTEVTSEHGSVLVTKVPADADLEARMAEAGPLVRNPDGRVARHVRPEKKVLEEQIAASNMKALPPHTELFERAEIPPRWIALQCVHAAARDGQTVLADAYAFLASEFTQAEQAELSSRLYHWRTPDVEIRHGISSASEVLAPAIAVHSRGIITRYSSNYMRLVPGDSLQERYHQGGRAFFDSTGVPMAVSSGEVLVFDNWRLWHGRKAFDDSRRYLRRVMAADPLV